jgi:Undecaprenyl-phosphate glucose phosphotransferase
VLRKYSQVFISVLFLTDIFFIAGAWLAAYLLRFKASLFDVPKEVPPWSQHLPLLLIVLLICATVFNFSGLYRPHRLSTIGRELLEISKAITIATLLFIFVTYFFNEYRYSRVTIALFWLTAIFLVTLSRILARKFLKRLRKAGYNRRFALIAGDGALGRKLLQSFHAHPEMGLQAVGFLTERPEGVGQRIDGVEVLGTFDQVHLVLARHAVDQVFIAIPFQQHPKIHELLTSIKDELVDIRVVSDLYDFITLRGGIDELDGLPIINIQDSPLQGWGKIAKRAVDVACSLLGVVLLSPLLAVISILVKITSPGPLLYRQKRMGFDGEVFEILKFRSMVDGAEEETGSVWARPDDPRRTRLGKFLRRTSLDELPQLVNVLRGEMSLVGPRPERPELIEQFKGKIPRYMLRHKIKAGMTGWAQVNGWRGNTSLERRIEHDLYYIENWSLAFDLRIIALTVVRGMFSKQAY